MSKWQAIIEEVLAAFDGDVLTPTQGRYVGRPWFGEQQGKLLCCGLTSLYLKGHPDEVPEVKGGKEIEPTDITSWVQTAYGLDYNEVRWFIIGFDGRSTEGCPPVSEQSLAALNAGTHIKHELLKRFPFTMFVNGVGG